MGNYLLRLVGLTSGAAMVLLGVVGLFLPLLQGVLLIVVGISLMSLASERAARWRRRLGQKLRAWLPPRVRRWLPNGSSR